MDLTTTLLLVALCTLLEGFFSGAEIAMISASRIKIQHKVSKGDKASLIVSDLLNTPDRLFTTTSLGTNLAVVTSTAIFTAYMISRLGPQYGPQYGDVLTMFLLSPFILLFGEIVPKVIFQNAADTLVLFIARPLRIFCRIFAPIVAFFTLLRAGAGVPARIYPGGWAEWAADGSLPADAATYPDRAGSIAAAAPAPVTPAWPAFLAAAFLGGALAAGGFYLGRRGHGSGRSA